MFSLMKMKTSETWKYFLLLRNCIHCLKVFLSPESCMICCQDGNNHKQTVCFLLTFSYKLHNQPVFIFTASPA